VSARAGSHVVLFVGAMTLSFGLAVALTSARLAGVSPAIAAPAIVLGCAAIPWAVAELMTRLRVEVGLARMRGREGLPLALTASREPMFSVLLGAAAGSFVAYSVAVLLLQRRYQQPLTWLVSLDQFLGVITFVGIALVSSLWVLRTMVRAPLAEQLAAVSRKSSTTSPTLLTFVFLSAAAASVSVFVLGTEGGWWAMAAPALLGVAVGASTMVLLRYISKLTTAAKASPSWFLATRRLRRTQELEGAVWLLVAGGVVAACGLSGSLSVAKWTEDVTQNTQLGAYRVRSELGAAPTLALTQSLDPSRQHLMTVVFVDSPNLAERRAFVDSERFAAATDNRFSSQVAEAVNLLTPLIPPVLLQGRAGRLVVSSPPGVDLQLGVRYVNDSDVVTQVQVAVPGATPAGLRRVTTTASFEVPDCVLGCVLQSVTVDVTDRQLPPRRVPLDQTAAIREPIEVNLLEIAIEDAVISGKNFVDRTADAQANGTFWTGNPIVLTSSVATQPVLLAAGSEQREFDDVGGSPRLWSPAIKLPVLPVVGSQGALADLNVGLAGSLPTAASAQVWVVANKSTPTEVLATLSENLGHRATSLAEERSRIALAAGGGQSGVLAMLGICGAIVGLMTLGSALLRHLASRSGEVSALRLVGVDLATIRRSDLIESALVAAVLAIVTAAASAVAVSWFVPRLTLLRTQPWQPELAIVSPVTVGLWCGVVLGAGYFCASLVARAKARRQGRPATLREWVAE
jgi:hypothetical protein